MNNRLNFGSVMLKAAKIQPKYQEVDKTNQS